MLELPMIERTKTAVGSRQDIFLIENFLAADECRDLIAMAERGGFEAAKITTAAGQVSALHIRNNDRLIWDDSTLADKWWARAKSFFPANFGRWTAHGLNERFRFYRYRPGQRFAPHRDGSFERTNNEISWMTLMVYLNDGYEGGRTCFDLRDEPQSIAIKPKKGMALAFMHDRLHEGEALRAGVKYVLRTDVMYRRS
jgi:prolyl 4-hydroxylase